MSEWLYNGAPVQDKDIEDAYGFVYIIENLETGKKYIGKKFFWNQKKLIRKTTRNKRVLKESDWRTYWGSNKTLLADVERLGKDKFKRTIVRLCDSKGETSYQEAKLQFETDCIKSDEYLNDWVIVRVTRKHVNEKKKKNVLPRRGV